MEHSEYNLTEVAGPASLRYHWFANSSASDSLSDFSQKVSFLDSCGYYSVLLPYNNNLSDWFIRAARTLVVGEKIKYNIALRSTSISPEYCSMMARAFSSIDGGRLILNVLSGSPQVSENVDILLQERSATKQSVIEFLKYLNSDRLFNKTKTEIMVPGNASEIIKAAALYADYGATDIISLEREDTDSKLGRDKILEYKTLPRLVVSTDIVVSANDSEKKSFIDRYGESGIIVGSLEEIGNRIAELQQRGMTDILIANHPGDKFPHRIHDVIGHQL